MDAFKVGLMAIATLMAVVYMSIKITSNQSGFGDYVSYRTIVKDASGKSFVPREALDTISQSSSVPVYGLWDTYVGHGIIGGHLCSFDLLGKNVNRMITRILNGESLDKIHPIILGPSIYIGCSRSQMR